MSYYRPCLRCGSNLNPKMQPTPTTTPPIPQSERRAGNGKTVPAVLSQTLSLRSLHQNARHRPINLNPGCPNKEIPFAGQFDLTHTARALLWRAAHFAVSAPLFSPYASR